MRSVLAGFALAALLTSAAHADLVGYDDNLVYYDTANITWTREAVLAEKLPQVPPYFGALTKAEAVSFASSLDFDGITGWRLPTAAEISIWANQMGYPVRNVRTALGYWSSDSNQLYDIGNSYAFITPAQDLGYAWVVHDGNVIPVPEPATYALMCAGLAIIVQRRRSRRG